MAGSDATVTVTRVGNLSYPVAVGVATVNGTAHAGTDYTGVDTELDFAAGQGTASTLVSTVAGTTTDRSFRVRLTMPDAISGVVRGPRNVTVTVTPS